MSGVIWTNRWSDPRTGHPAAVDGSRFAARFGAACAVASDASITPVDVDRQKLGGGVLRGGDSGPA